MIAKIKEEIAEFKKESTDRQWPDVWIFATNIDPSGKPETGAFDQARKLVREAQPRLAHRFAIWGGRKILDLLALHPEVAQHYGEFLTAGDVLSRLMSEMKDSYAEIESIIRYLVVTQLEEQQYTKLEQAGSTTDTRPGIQKLFTDLPFVDSSSGERGMAAANLAKASAQLHRVDTSTVAGDRWHTWNVAPRRARVWFVKGGPGNGKSTLTQYISQIQRASLVRTGKVARVGRRHREIAKDVCKHAEQGGLLPLAARIPVTVELKEFAQWYSRRTDDDSKRLVAFVAHDVSIGMAQDVPVGRLRRAFETSRWMFVFDGLDEVPGDVKDVVASEVTHFINDFLIDCNSDAFVICTSRPQGYSGQFAALEASQVTLTRLSPNEALTCAEPLLRFDRSESEARVYIERLSKALKSPVMQEIMTTPLQAHIMAVVVRNGEKPPERKWQLFENFYQTIKRREANRDLPNQAIATLLSEEDHLLRALHNRLGFSLHERAELSANAVTSLTRSEFRILVREVVESLKERDIESLVRTLDEATTQRLVLVNTPESGEKIRFDIRPLQEFFASEYLCDVDDPQELGERLRVLAADSHWREVLHFLFSGLVEKRRNAELTIGVSALRDLDNGNGDSLLRPFFRRLAVGAIVAARLLQEGVLEQDKRVRAKFRDVIGSLFACPEILNLVEDFTAPSSKAWFEELLFSAISENSHTENIGTVILATQIIPDGHPRTDEITSFVVNSPKPYQSFFFSIQEDRTYRYRHVSTKNKTEIKEPWKWFVTCALKVLIDPHWLELSPAGLRGALFVLEKGQKHLDEVVSSIGIDQDTSEILRKFIGIGRRTHRLNAEHEVHSGVLTVRHYDLEKDVEWNQILDKVMLRFEFTTGILRAIYLATKVLRTKERRDERALQEFLGESPYILRILSIRLSSYFCFSQQPQSAEIKLNRGKPFLKNVLIRERVPDGDDWSMVLLEYPGVALSVIAGDLGVLNSYENLERYISSNDSSIKLSAFTGEVILQKPGAWSFLFNLPEIGDRFRKETIEAAMNGRKIPYDIPALEIRPFDVVFPGDMPLLPYLIVVFTYWANARGRQRVIGEEKRSSVNLIRSRMRDFKIKIDDVRKFRLSKDIPIGQRAAANVFYLATRLEKDSASDKDFSEIPQFYCPTESAWYPYAIATLLRESVAENFYPSLAAVASLLELSKTDLEARTALSEVFSDWRQVARAPVYNSEQHMWIRE
ncbi:NACHT domain-containing NTPase [Pelagibius sp.]|uniref:NACHT domain-containing protein n=1 Tax=Pelagibius sp. TaxID=1931238 RepID=UPI00261A9BC5|nr:hypothetical protein [Pelagibius sp.]